MGTDVDIYRKQFALPPEFWGARMYPNPTRDQGDPNTQCFMVDGKPEFFSAHTGEDENGGVYMYSCTDFEDQVWEPHGTVCQLPAGGPWNCWAPCLASFSDLACIGGPYFIVVSLGKGHAKHKLHVFRASKPVGPYVLHSILETNDDFAIDAALYDEQNGGRMLGYSRNLYEGRVGTAIVLAQVSSDLMRVGRTVPLYRATSDRQVYEYNRVFDLATCGLDIPECYHQGDGSAVVDKWHTVEGISQRYRNRFGQNCWLCSGGRFGSDIEGLEYFTSLLVEQRPGKVVDVTLEYNHVVIPPRVGTQDAGHADWFWGPEDDPQVYLSYHERNRVPPGTTPPPRQACIAPMVENNEGWLYCLTL